MEKRNGPKRVLMVVSRMHYGGVETMLMNLMRNMDRDKVVFDFMVNYAERGAYDDEIRAMGGRIYLMPRLFLRNTVKYIKALREFFVAHREYDIIHGHVRSAALLYLGIAKRYGVKTKIIHAHSTSIRRRLKWFVERALMLLARRSADYYFACSDAAGRYYFGEKRLSAPNYKVIKNGIMVDRYAFDAQKRAAKRAELGIENCFVLGSVGRFVPEKNHKQMLEIFAEVKRRCGDAVLLLAGDGMLFEDCKKQARMLGISDSVLFLGMRGDANELMMAMDVFLLPSFYEGLPVTSIEAQAAGLLGFYSDTITKETDVSGLCRYLPLETKVWADEIIRQGRSYERKSQKEAVVRAGYDVAAQAKWLQAFYLSH